MKNVFIISADRNGASQEEKEVCRAMMHRALYIQNLSYIVGEGAHYIGPADTIREHVFIIDATNEDTDFLEFLENLCVVFAQDFFVKIDAAGRVTAMDVAGNWNNLGYCCQVGRVGGDTTDIPAPYASITLSNGRRITYKFLTANEIKYLKDENLVGRRAEKETGFEIRLANAADEELIYYA